MSLEKDTIITLENKEKYVIENITYYGGIKYALANGYTFRPLTMESPNVHHGLNN